MLRNRRGGPSLRWLKALLDHDVTVHGQIVVCPSVNDGVILEDTLASIFEQYRSIRSICVVPLGVSKHSNEKRMRPHTLEEAENVLETVEQWQKTFLRHVGRSVVHAADELSLIHI